MSTGQWLRQPLQDLELASSMHSQREGDKCSVGPETVAAWTVMGSIQEYLQGTDDERLLHPPLSQDWVLGSVDSFFHVITRCLDSPTQLPDACQM